MLKLLFILLTILATAAQAAERELAFDRSFTEIKLEGLSYLQLPVDEGFDPKALFDERWEGWQDRPEPLVIENKGKASRYFMRLRIQADEHAQAVLSYRWNYGILDAELFRKGPDEELERWESKRPGSPLWIVRLKPGANDFLIMVESNAAASFKRVLYVSSAEHFLVAEGEKSNVFMAIYGMAIALIVFNISMLFIYRKPYFLFYIIYSAASLFTLMTGSSHIPLKVPFFWNFSLFVAATATTFLSTSILQLRSSMPRVYRLITGVYALSALAYAANVVVFLKIEFFYFTALGVCSLSAFAAIRRMLQGYKPAIFFALGWSVISVGYGLNYLSIFIRGTMLTSMASYYAYAIENILFAIAVVYRTRDSEQKAERAKDHAYSQLEKVVYAHQVQQIESGKDIEETMPTHQGDAAVISFDIVESSQLQHERKKDFIRKLFRRCGEAMMDGYDGSVLKANAYRIKEMGDGFLCSVGYPFQSPTGHLAKDAINLAQTFYRIFQEEVQALDYPNPVRCGIGIAMGPISGFYPESGTKEYDLYGQAIVLATRYEGMRKVLSRHIPPSSFVILQERVYLSLAKDDREAFTTFDLTTRNITVRDDPGAKRIYFLDYEETQTQKPYLPEHASA